MAAPARGKFHGLLRFFFKPERQHNKSTSISRSIGVGRYIRDVQAHDDSRRFIKRAASSGHLAPRTMYIKRLDELNNSDRRTSEMAQDLTSRSEEQHLSTKFRQETLPETHLVREPLCRILLNAVLGNRSSLDTSVCMKANTIAFSLQFSSQP